MNRATAIKKLATLLGKSCGYRINDKAPTPEERDAARAELPAATEKAKALRDQREARQEALLKADSEYQELRAACKAAFVEKKRIAAKLYSYKITVGKSNGLFFSVMAEGDSWEEIFAKLEKKQAA